MALILSAGLPLYDGMETLAGADQASENADIYVAASKGVSAKTIEREFGQWLTSNQKMEDLYDAIEAFDLPATRKRMSSTEIRRNLQ